MLFFCCICEKQFRQLNASHLSIHSLTVRQYCEQFANQSQSIMEEQQQRLQKMASKKRGSHLSIASIEKIRVSKIGKKQTAISNAKRSKTLKGRQFSEETIQKMRASATGRHYSPIVLAKGVETRKRKGSYSIPNSGQFQKGHVSQTRGQTKENNITAAKISEKVKEGYLAGRVVFQGSPGFFAEDVGHYVRSMWEANFVRMLCFFGIVYEYEKYRFKLSNNTIYIPDFWIPSLNSFVEIKGSWNGKPKINKAQMFIDDKIGNLFLLGIVEYKQLNNMFKDIIPNWNFKPNSETKRN